MKKKTKHNKWACVDCGKKLTKSEMVRVIIAMLDVHFGGKFSKTDTWLRTENPLLGGLKPNDMIEAGRHEKLFKFVRNTISENKPVGNK